MAQRTVVDCDRCGAKSIPAAIRIHVPVRLQADPATGRKEYGTEPFDLCPGCAEIILGDQVSTWTVPMGCEWAEKTRRKEKVTS
jgi:hypothetical protein